MHYVSDQHSQKDTLHSEILSLINLSQFEVDQ